MNSPTLPIFFCFVLNIGQLFFVGGVGGAALGLWCCVWAFSSYGKQKLLIAVPSLVAAPWF